MDGCVMTPGILRPTRRRRYRSTRLQTSRRRSRNTNGLTNRSPARSRGAPGHPQGSGDYLKLKYGVYQVPSASITVRTRQVPLQSLLVFHT